MTVSALLAILRRAKRRSQPRVAISLTVFAPNDDRAAVGIRLA